VRLFKPDFQQILKVSHEGNIYPAQPSLAGFGILIFQHKPK
jgi:hypothetical protein